MNQEDLVSENLTRGFISMIETGKRGISRDTAEVISNRLKEKADKLGIKLNIDADYLMRDSRAEAEFYCTQQLESITEISDALEVIHIAKEYNLENILANSYLRLGEIAFSRKDYKEAHINYVNSLDYHKDINVVKMKPYLYNKLGHCKLNLLEYLEALAYFNLANYHAVLQNDNSIKKMSTYNIALCNKKLNRIDAALEYIDIYLTLCDKEKEFTGYTYANVLKAICYEAKNSIDTSIQILMDLLKEFKDTDDILLGHVYNNLGEFYLKKDDLERSLDYFDKAQEIRTSKDIDNLSHTMIEKSRVYIKQKLHEQAISLIKEGMNLAHINNDIEYWLRANYMLADIYLILKNSSEVEKIYEAILSLFKKDDNTHKNELVNVYVRMSHLYLEKNNYNKLSEILFALGDIVGA